MKSIALTLFSLLCFLLVSCQSETPPVPYNPMIIPDRDNDNWQPQNGYELAWAEEFSESEIDTSIWSYETGATGWRHEWNQEWQDYVNDDTGGYNAFVRDQILVIRANMKKDRHGRSAYNSARLVTKNTANFRYGHIAARMALPFGQGIWPAFWMLGAQDNWPRGGEIDIMEMIGGDGSSIGNDNSIHGTIHWQNPQGNHTYRGQSTTLENPQDFNVYELLWCPEKIQIGVNGNFYFEQQITDSQFSAFHKDFYLLLNLAIGGSWGGYPDQDTAFPQYLFVDWIRVYQHPDH